MFRKKAAAETSVRETLLCVPIFQALSKKELKRIEDHVYLRTYRPGEYIYQQGEPGLGMYVVHQGAVRIEARAEPPSPSGPADRDLSRGDSFSEAALLDHYAHPVSARATADTSVLGFYRPDLFTLIHYYPRLGNKLLLSVARLLVARLLACSHPLHNP